MSCLSEEISVLALRKGRKNQMPKEEQNFPSMKLRERRKCMVILFLPLKHHATATGNSAHS